jgi:hypothetical protein
MLKIIVILFLSMAWLILQLMKTVHNVCHLPLLHHRHVYTVAGKTNFKLVLEDVVT